MCDSVKSLTWYHWPLRILTFVLSWFYICTFLQVFNICANAIWIIKIRLKHGRWKMLKEELRLISINMKTIYDVDREYKIYQYMFDGITAKSDSIFGKWPTWIPLPIVFLAKERRDNCDGSAMWIRWLIAQLKKNDAAHKVNTKCVQHIYVPIFPWKWDKVHYLASVSSFDDLGQYRTLIYSNGKTTAETKDDLAERFLKCDARYIWL